MNRLASSRLLSLLPLLAACAMPVGEGDASSDAVRAAEQPLSAAERRERAALIRDLFAEQGITQGWLAAGLADAETMMTHCRYGETGYWERAGCSGPESAECGGPVLAGGGDGPCSLREGGLGMFQFDAGDFDETLAREGRGILSLEGNIRSAVRFVVDMVERSTYIPGVRSRADAIRWLNGVEGPDDPDFEAWVQTVTHYYNGCRPGRCSVYASRYDHYATNARNMWSEMGGAAFWTEAPVGAVDEDGLDPRVPPAEPMGPTVSDALGEHRGGCTTAGFATLSRQLAEHQGCLFPDHALVEVRHPNVRVASERVHLFFEAETAAALQRAAEEVPLTVTSGFRTVADQYALARRGGCPAVARPGSSWHQSGRAVDVANYGEARAAMERAGFRWYGAGDPVHFTGPGSDRRSRSVLAFQNLWNLNHPEDPIAEDGLWGPDTEARLRRAPMGGFPRTGCGCTPHCEGGVAVDASCGRMDCGGVTCVEEGGAARCAEVPTEAPGCDGLTTCLEHFGGLACFDEHEEVLACGHHGGGVACFDACGGAPDVCPEALACWRGGGGGACFRPERCGLEEAPEP
ncbi:MAG TPA: M15 family metallopeptidase, partial [Polyangiaceae bacterium LLY-WYZ-15_(1-7)]|nr:M15 family metallopeptidase [Polyangiaceae bacterium LLY-WYZ-15_(1-7)]